MRVEKQIMDNSDHNRITWNDDDWDLVAAELKRQNPTRQTTSYFRFDFTIMEIEDAAEIVISQQRQRSFNSFDEVRRPLFNAFERMKPNAKKVINVAEGRSRIDGAIYWSPEEWEAIAEELHDMDSTVYERRCAGIGIKEVNAAQSILPVGRRRIFKQVVGFRAQILKTWEHLQAAKKDAAPPVIVDFKSGPIMEPPPRKSDGNSALATAMHEAFKSGPVEKKPRKRKVYWTNVEWLTVAREMRRQNPHLNFFASKFSDIDLPAIRDAQRSVLPLERRKTMAGQRGLQEPLVAAFKDLRNELEEELANSANGVEDKEQEAIAEHPPLQIAKPEPVQEAPAPVAEFKPVLQAATVETSFNAAVLNAAGPLVNLMIDEVVKRLLPQLSGMLIPELTKSITTTLQSTLAGVTRGAVTTSETVVATGAYVVPVAAQAAPQAGRLSAKEIAAFLPVPETKPKKPKIALLGPMGRQKNDIEMTFPDYRFVFIENGHGIKEAAVDCELFIVYTSHFNAANKASVKKHVPVEKVRQVSGSISAVKHQIHSWKAMNDAANATK